MAFVELRMFAWSSSSLETVIPSSFMWPYIDSFAAQFAKEDILPALTRMDYVALHGSELHAQDIGRRG